MIYRGLRSLWRSLMAVIKRELTTCREPQSRAAARPVETHPVPPEDVHKAFEESWRDNERGYRYLADR